MNRETLKNMDVNAVVAAVVADDPDAAAIAADLALSLEQAKAGEFGKIVELPEDDFPRNEELFPAELADKLIGADCRLTVWREYRGLSREELAQYSGVSIDFINDLEAGKFNSLLKDLQAISSALSIDMELII